MTEVFKTDVTDLIQAQLLIRRIQDAFSDYTASFDLEDCDRVLCVRSVVQPVQVTAVIRILVQAGYQATVLPD